MRNVFTLQFVLNETSTFRIQFTSHFTMASGNAESSENFKHKPPFIVCVCFSLEYGVLCCCIHPRRSFSYANSNSNFHNICVFLFWFGLMPNESEVVNAFEWHISGNRWSHLSLLRRGNGNGLDNAKLIETEKGFCHIHKCIQYSPILFHFTLLAELFYECRIDKNRDRTLCAAPSICGDVPRWASGFFTLFQQ